MSAFRFPDVAASINPPVTQDRTYSGCSAEFININTEFLVFDTQFITFTHRCSRCLFYYKCFNRKSGYFH